jgi:hypothetical protein
MMLAVMSAVEEAMEECAGICMSYVQNLIERPDEFLSAVDLKLSAEGNDAEGRCAPGDPFLLQAASKHSNTEHDVAGYPERSERPFNIETACEKKLQGNSEDASVRRSSVELLYEGNFHSFMGVGQPVSPIIGRKPMPQKSSLPDILEEIGIGNHRLKKITFDAAKSLGIGFNTSMEVKSTTRGGQAESLGVKTGWVAISANDRPLTRLEDMRGQVASARWQRERSLVLAFRIPPEVLAMDRLDEVALSERLRRHSDPVPPSTRSSATSTEVALRAAMCQLRGSSSGRSGGRSRSVCVVGSESGGGDPPTALAISTASGDVG